MHYHYWRQQIANIVGAHTTLAKYIIGYCSGYEYTYYYVVDIISFHRTFLLQIVHCLVPLLGLQIVHCLVPLLGFQMLVVSNRNENKYCYCPCCFHKLFLFRLRWLTTVLRSKEDLIFVFNKIPTGVLFRVV